MFIMDDILCKLYCDNKFGWKASSRWLLVEIIKEKKGGDVECDKHSTRSQVYNFGILPSSIGNFHTHQYNISFFGL